MLKGQHTCLEWGHEVMMHHRTMEGHLRSRLQEIKVENWDQEEGMYNTGHHGFAWCLSGSPLKECFYY